MKKITAISTLVFYVVILASTQSFASELVWYDQENQAIAIDPYADGWGGRVEIDFNADHTYAGTINQNLWHYLYGYVTNVGLRERIYHVTVYGGYTSTRFAWGEFLGILEPRYDYSSEVTTLGSMLSPETFYYFTPEWNVEMGKTVIYVQPMVDSVPQPVFPEDLGNFYYGIGSNVITSEVVWQQLPGVISTEPQPEPEPTPIPEPEPSPDPVPSPCPHHDPGPVAQANNVEVNVIVSPAVLNNRSKGQWVTARIELPEPYGAEDLDLDTVRLSIQADILDGDEIGETVSLVSKVARAGQEGNKLIAKFDREELMDLLPLGDSKVYVYGTLDDGSTIEGETSLKLID